MIGTGETTIKISGCELRTAVAGSFEMIDSLIEMRGLESGEGHALSIYIYILFKDSKWHAQSEFRGEKHVMCSFLFIFHCGQFWAGVLRTVICFLLFNVHFSWFDANDSHAVLSDFYIYIIICAYVCIYTYIYICTSHLSVHIYIYIYVIIVAAYPMVVQVLFHLQMKTMQSRSVAVIFSL